MFGANPHLADQNYKDRFTDKWVATLQPAIDKLACLEEGKTKIGVKSANEEMNVIGWRTLAEQLISDSLAHYSNSEDKGYRQVKKICKNLLTNYRLNDKGSNDPEIKILLSFNTHINDWFRPFKQATRLDYGLRVEKRKATDAKIEVDLGAYLQQALEVLTAAKADELNKTAWKQVSASLALVTGRRMAEIHQTAIFEQIGDRLLKFSGRLKTGSNSSRESVYEIPTLIDAGLCIEGLEWLKRYGKRLDNEGDPLRVNGKYSKDLSHEIKTNWYVVADDVWKEVETLEGKDPKDSKASMSYHKLRACYHVCSKANWLQNGGDPDDYSLAARNWLADDRDASVESYKRLKTVPGSITQL